MLSMFSGNDVNARTMLSILTLITIPWGLLLTIINMITNVTINCENYNYDISDNNTHDQ